MSTTTTEAPFDVTEKTVEELRALDGSELSGPEIEALLTDERNRPDDDRRDTALDALGDAFDAATAGPDEGESDPGPQQDEDVDADASVTAMDVDTAEADENGQVSVARGQGHGGTEAGQPGVVLPDPYGEDAPETVSVVIPNRMTFAGSFYDDPGVEAVRYTMRVKTALETETNEVALAPNDPLHPSNGEE